MLVAATIGLAGCGEPAHEFVGDYRLEVSDPIFTNHDAGTVEIGDDYITIFDQTFEFEVIGVHNRFGNRTLILGSKALTMKWKIIDDNTLEADLKSLGLGAEGRHFKYKLFRQ